MVSLGGWRTEVSGKRMEYMPCVGSIHSVEEEICQMGSGANVHIWYILKRLSSPDSLTYSNISTHNAGFLRRSVAANLAPLHSPCMTSADPLAFNKHLTTTSITKTAQKL